MPSKKPAPTDPLEGFPHGATDFDQDDVLVGLVDGRAAVVPRSLQRLDGETKVDLAQLMKAVHAINELHEHVAGLVADLRLAGVSWSGIGWALGTTGEAARQRFGDA